MLVGMEDYDSESLIKFVENYNQHKVKVMREKDRQYGGSWQKDGAIGAYLNLKRKMDRILNKFTQGTLFNFDTDSAGENNIDTFLDMENYSSMLLGYLFLSCKDQKTFDHFINCIPTLRDHFTFDVNIGKVVAI